MTPFTPTLDGGTYIEATSATLVSENKADSGYKGTSRPAIPLGTLCRSLHILVSCVVGWLDVLSYKNDGEIHWPQL